MAPQGSHCWGGDGSLLFPRRLSHRSTPLTPQGSSGLHSKLFTPSIAFASADQARLPVGPLREKTFDAAGFTLCCGPVSCTLPRRARPRASTPRSPRTPTGYYKGALVIPLTGLTPASHRELQDAVSGVFFPRVGGRHLAGERGQLAARRVRLPTLLVPVGSSSRRPR
jgi:hypothetical protein